MVTENGRQNMLKEAKIKKNKIIFLTSKTKEFMSKNYLEK